MSRIGMIFEQFAIDDHLVEVMTNRLSPDCAFIFQRAAHGASAPDFTYVGLDVEPLSLEDARALCNAPEVTRPSSADKDGLFGRLPFKGGVFVFVPHEFSPSRGDGPSMTAWFTRRLLAIDHGNGQAYLIHLSTSDEDESAVRAALRDWIATNRNPVEDAAPGGAAPPRSGEEWVCDVDFDEYARRLGHIQQGISEGHLRQAILSLGMSRTTTAPPRAVFAKLRSRAAASHTFLINLDGLSVVGASPAMHLSKQGDLLSVESDAGTRRVGASAAEDRAIEQELLSSQKDIEEQQMIVEETIADVAAIARSGQVDTPVELEVRRQGQVMHLYTVLEARLNDGIGPLDAVLSCFPPAAVTGSPKAVARKYIREAEGAPRGPYAGVAGLIGLDGSVDTAVVLRSAWILGERIFLRCGGGITAASVVEEEYRECMNKAATLIDCVAAAEAELAGGALV